MPSRMKICDAESKEKTGKRNWLGIENKSFNKQFANCDDKIIVLYYILHHDILHRVSFCRLSIDFLSYLCYNNMKQWVSATIFARVRVESFSKAANRLVGKVKISSRCGA